MFHLAVSSSFFLPHFPQSITLEQVDPLFLVAEYIIPVVVVVFVVVEYFKSGL